MADRTNIEWTRSPDGTPGATWPVTTGCDHVSDGCDVCYAARQTSGRLQHLPEYAGLAVAGRFTGEVRCLPERLDWPRHWRKPRRIFVCSMSDLFHPGVPDEFIAKVWQVMASCPQHTFIVLTKRHARMRAWVNRCQQSPGGWITHDGTDPAGACDGTGVIVGYPYRSAHVVYGRRGKRTEYPASGGWPLPNVWVGVSVENQKWADIRIPALLDTPAAVRFLSCEPLLGPLDLGMCDWIPPGEEGFAGVHNPLTGEWWPAVGDPAEEYANRITDLPRIDWVIAGGESGPGARPAHPAWIRSLRDQCGNAQVAFNLKQRGAWTWERRPGDPAADTSYVCQADGRVASEETAIANGGSWAGVRRVGKKAAGRELDGRIWDEYPAIPHPRRNP